MPGTPRSAPIYTASDATSLLANNYENPPAAGIVFTSRLSCRYMRCLRFAIKLPFFLIAEAVLWLVVSFASHLGLHQVSETLAQHRRLVDWLCGRKARQWYSLARAYEAFGSL